MITGWWKATDVGFSGRISQYLKKKKKQPCAESCAVTTPSLGGFQFVRRGFGSLNRPLPLAIPALLLTGVENGCKSQGFLFFLAVSSWREITP